MRRGRASAASAFHLIVVLAAVSTFSGCGAGGEQADGRAAEAKMLQCLGDSHIDPERASLDRADSLTDAERAAIDTCRTTAGLGTAAEANAQVDEALRKKDAEELACIEGKGWSTRVDDATNPIVLASTIPTARRDDFIDDYFRCLDMDEATQASLRPLMSAATEKEAAEQRMLDLRDAASNR